MIGATSLRTNIGHTAGATQSFGKSAATRTNTAANIAKGAGALAVTAVGAYFMKGKLASLIPFKGLVSGVKTFFTNIASKVNVGGLIEKAKGLYTTAKTFVTGLFSKVKVGELLQDAKTFCSGLMTKAGKVFDGLKGIFHKA